VGITRKAAVCVPPSSTKSKVISVLFQPWVWIWWPESAWITCTYEKDLATDLSVESRDLVISDWYQARWPLELTKDAGHHWKNAKGGWRRALGTGGAITGKHGHFHIGDDLVKEQDVRFGTPMAVAKVLEKANGFWFGTMVTRKAAKAIARILVGQMLHVDDTPNVAIKKHKWEHLVLPMRAEVDHEYHAPCDVRPEGELLCLARNDEESVRELEIELGPSGASAQLQQRPIPPGGQLLKPEYFARRYDLLPGRLQSWLAGDGKYPGIVCRIYGDMTFKGKPTSDYTVYQCWAFFEGEPWLIDQVRGQWKFSEAKSELLAFKVRWPMATMVKLEDAANAPAIVDDMRQQIQGLVLAPMQGGCLARTQQCEGHWASQPHLPAQAPWMGGSDGFVAEHLSFDGLGTRHDDQVATSSLALLDLSSGTAKSYIDKMKRVQANMGR